MKFVSIGNGNKWREYLPHDWKKFWNTNPSVATKYTIMFRYPNSGQNQNIRIANESFENVAKFK
jgi:hypothetical protein